MRRLVVVVCAVGLFAYLRGLSRPAVATVPPVPEDEAPVAGADAGADDGASADESAGLGPVAELETRAEYEAARAELEARVAELEDDGATADVVLGLARLSTVERMCGDEDAALASAERAVELAPDVGLAHFVLARALARKLQTGGKITALRRLGDYKDALARAVELDPSNVAARVQQAAFYVKAPGIVGGDVDVARELAGQLESADPAAAAWIRVEALREEERFDEAEELCRRALDEAPDDAELRASLAGLLVETERPDEAIREYERVLEGRRGATYYRALYEAARALAEAEREPGRVIELLREYVADVPLGLDLAPPLARAHWRIGQAHERLGREGRARAAYEAALEEDPELDEAAEALEALEALEASDERE